MGEYEDKAELPAEMAAGTEETEGAAVESDAVLADDAEQ